MVVYSAALPFFIMPFTIDDPTDSGLCGRCDHSQVIRGDRLKDHTVLCNWQHPALNITRLVRRCSLFEAKNSISKSEMEKIGWVLEVKGGKVIGFKPPKRGADE